MLRAENVWTSRFFYKFLVQKPMKDAIQTTKGVTSFKYKKVHKMLTKDTKERPGHYNNCVILNKCHRQLFEILD